MLLSKVLDCQAAQEKLEVLLRDRETTIETIADLDQRITASDTFYRVTSTLCAMSTVFHSALRVRPPAASRSAIAQ